MLQNARVRRAHLCSIKKRIQLLHHGTTGIKMDEISDCLRFVSVDGRIGGLDSLPIFTIKQSLTMKKNMGSTDKTIRLLLAAVFAVLFFTGVVGGLLGYILLALGGIFVLTSLVGFCPLYALVGMSTCPAETHK